MAKRKPSELNLLLAVDKPVGMTSHDVVARVRRALNERRVGHAGTLDPLASGVMIVGVGQATRLLGRITLDRKCYLARIKFGFETTTDDAEGEPTRACPVADDLREPSFARTVLGEFLGEHEQVPPAYSAISVNGVRSYRRARAGEDVELPARPIEVHAADLVSIDAVDGDTVWTVAFDVSKGTYIRSLARDIGRAAGSAAHICDLRRTASGSVGLGSCAHLVDLDPLVARERMLDPARVLGVPMRDLSPRDMEDVRHGRCVSRDRVAYRWPEDVPAPPQSATAPQAPYMPVALVDDGKMVALAAPDGAWLKMELVFPQGIEGVAR